MAILFGCTHSTFFAFSRAADLVCPMTKDTGSSGGRIWLIVKHANAKTEIQVSGEIFS